MTDENKQQAYVIRGTKPGNIIEFYAIVVTPEPMTKEKVEAAWSYAVRYSAKGLDVPDYEAASKLLIERHPGWKIYEGKNYTIMYNSKLAEDDVPD